MVLARGGAEEAVLGSCKCGAWPVHVSQDVRHSNYEGFESFQFAPSAPEGGGSTCHRTMPHGCEACDTVAVSQAPSV